jgi:spore coat protein U-like protein
MSRAFAAIVLPLLFFCILALTLGSPDRARAQTCSSTVTDVDFGQPDVTSTTPADVLATLTVTCTHVPFLTVVKMCPNIGDGSGGDSRSARILRAGSGTLTYQLFQDSSRTQGWGAIDETALGTVPSILLNGGLSGVATTSRPIYARLFGSQSNAAAGVYTSTFAGSETAFTYSAFLLGATSNCSGFVGAAVVRPEFEVMAEISAYCHLTATDLDFGPVGVVTHAIDSQSIIQVACAPKTPFSLALDSGIAAAGPSGRTMTLGADRLAYGLYRDASRTVVWGDTGASLATGTGTGAYQSFYVYGRVPVQTSPRPGVYSDRIVATVTY